MRGIRVPLAVALLFISLVLLAFGTVNVASGPVWLVFRRAAGLETTRTIAVLAALLTALPLLAAALTVAIPSALIPAPRHLKWLTVLPVYLVGLTMAMAAANILGLATKGSILNSPSAVKISLAQAGLGAGTVLGAVAIVIASVRANLGPRILKTALALASIAMVLALVLVVATLAGVNIVVTQSGQLAAPRAGDQEGIAGLITSFQAGAASMAAFALVALGAILAGVRAWRRSRATPAAMMSSIPADYGREAMGAVGSVILITVVVFIIMQLVPISRVNPPVQGTVAWDSPQTQALVGRACMNCHSNETEWPWYSYFAPGSWITAVHVTSARQQFNLSELVKLSSSRRIRLARDMVDQIRNGAMPPSDYVLMHPEARLSPGEKDQLIQGLQNSLK